MEFKKCLSVRDASGRFAPVYDENDTITVECSNVIVSIGQRSEYCGIFDGSKVDAQDGKLIACDKVTFQTAEPDIFVGGDIATGPMYTIDAIANGREGAVSIHRFVNKGQSLTIHRNTRVFTELDKNNIVLPPEKIKKPARQIHAIDPEKVLSMHDERKTFTEEQIKAEASRCLSCGRSVVDQNKCIGCGICTTKCEFDAIHLKRIRPECSTMKDESQKYVEMAKWEAQRSIKIARKKAAELRK